MQRNLLLLTALLLSSTAAVAQEFGLSDLYGRGVHAYFSGQAFAAHESLSGAIKGGSRDPRAFYFRGLVNQQLGRTAEAQADFRAGAELEHSDAGGVFGVDRSLERVQGQARLTIERYRAIARASATGQVVLERSRRTLVADAARPQVSAPGAQVLAEQPADFTNPAGPAFGTAKPEETEPPPPAVPVPPKPAPGVNPLQEPTFEATPMPAKPPAAAPAKPAAPAAPDPFGEPTAPATKPNPPGGEGGSSGTALGNALKKAFGGFVPSLPEMPAIPGTGPAPAPGNNQPM